MKILRRISTGLAIVVLFMACELTPNAVPKINPIEGPVDGEFLMDGSICSYYSNFTTSPSSFPPYNNETLPYLGMNIRIWYEVNNCSFYDYIFTGRMTYNLYGQVSYQTFWQHTVYALNNKTFDAAGISNSETLWSNPDLAGTVAKFEVFRKLKGTSGLGSVVASKNITLLARCQPVMMSFKLNDGYPQLGETVPYTISFESCGASFTYKARIKYTLYGRTQYQYLTKNGYNLFSASKSGSVYVGEPNFTYTYNGNITLYSNTGLGYKTITLQLVDEDYNVVYEENRTLFP